MTNLEHPMSTVLRHQLKKCNPGDVIDVRNILFGILPVGTTNTFLKYCLTQIATQVNDNSWVYNGIHIVVND